MDSYQYAYLAGLLWARGYAQPLLIVDAAVLLLALVVAITVSLRIRAWRQR